MIDTKNDHIITDLVSVVIPCYNHGRYLSASIESVVTQDHKNVEVIVVDDGSTDNTKDEVFKYPFVQYVYQPNQGLSAARNTGIAYSKGSYLVFLDADDWLLPNAITTNLNYLQQNENAAFVSGAHDVVYEDRKSVETTMFEVTKDHYQYLLKGNYIGMHATVMYRRSVFDEFKYDTSLKACEDYDLYLRIVRKYPVMHHTQRMAAYRIHNENMSADIPLMLHFTLQVLQRQQEHIHSQMERSCLEEGLRNWKKYYTKEAYLKLYYSSFKLSKGHSQLYQLLWKNDKELFTKYLAQQPASMAKTKMKKMKKMIKNNLPDFISKSLHKAGYLKKFIPAIGKVDLGDLDRTTPLSKEFGYDRGGPVDRYYIENFLQQNSELIKGRVLEIGDNEYTLRYGGAKVTKSDILHIDASNTKATFVGDLSNAPHLPDDSFDCIILTQTLHLIWDYHAALATCNRVLKNGGALLLTVPGISHIDQGAWGNIWLWSFTKASITKMLGNVFTEKNIEVQSHGNVLAATAFLYGMGKPELTNEKLDVNDPHYQLIVTAKAIK